MQNLNGNESPKVAVLSHYLYPDDVVSARHCDGFCDELIARGWQVEALPCNRGCRDESKHYPHRSSRNGIDIKRVWRPNFKQATTVGRLLNSFWMILSWSTLVLRKKQNLPDVVVITTDPVFAVVVAAIIKRLRPQVRIAHWCWDVYPEAAVADGMFSEHSVVVRGIRRVMRIAYRSCDLVANLGSCMQNLLDTYQYTCRSVPLFLWALHEPQAAVKAEASTRTKLYGDAPLALLYSGNFGRAHSFEDFLGLARCLTTEARICFSVRGNRVQELRAAVRTEDHNVTFADFASETELGNHLGAADIHLVSLRPAWTGVVVPSKFWGCLAVGRPVIFAGSRQSCIAKWILEHKVGWVLDQTSLQAVAHELKHLASSKEHLLELHAHCHKVYQQHFCKRLIMDQWDRELRALLQQRP